MLGRKREPQPRGAAARAFFSVDTEPRIRPRSQAVNVMTESPTFGWQPAIQCKSREPMRADHAHGAAPRPGRDCLAARPSRPFFEIISWLVYFRIMERC